MALSMTRTSSDRCLILMRQTTHWQRESLCLFFVCCLFVCISQPPFLFNQHSLRSYLSLDQLLTREPFGDNWNWFFYVLEALLVAHPAWHDRHLATSVIPEVLFRGSVPTWSDSRQEGLQKQNLEKLECMFLAWSERMSEVVDDENGVECAKWSCGLLKLQKVLFPF